MKRIIYLPFNNMIKWVNSVLNGYYNYFAVPDNLNVLSNFRFEIMKIIYKSLHRLSQRCKWNWDKFNKHIATKLKFPTRVHPYPSQRM